MTSQLAEVVKAASALSPTERRELIQVLEQSLEKSSLESLSEEFWQSRSVDELAQMQRTPIVTDIRNLAVDWWPEDESIDEFLAFVAEQRRINRENSE